MYTLLELESKTFGELKKIGYELNVLPKGDRRCRQSWIDALVNINPPLSALLEDSSAEVEQAQEWVDPEPPNREDYEFREEYDEALKEWSKTVTSTQKSIDSSAVETSPSVGVDPVSESIAQAAETSPGVDVEQVQDTINQTWTSWEKEYCSWLKNATWCIHQGENKRIEAFLPAQKTLRLEGMKNGAEYCAMWEVSDCYYDFNGLPLPVCTSLYAQEPPLERAQEPIENPPDVEVDQAQEPIAQVAKTSSGVDVDRAQTPVMETVETSPGVDLAEDELPGCTSCFGDGYIEDEFGFIKFCQCETEPILSHQRTPSAIEQSVEKSPGVDCVYCHSPEYESLRDESYRCYKCKPEPDQNPILTGVALSDRFLATYPPYFGEIRYKAEVTGQLNLLEPVTDDEPPDPDDFESLDAFREAIARWDWEHPSSFDHCSDLPNSVYSEPNSVRSEPNSVHSDPLEVSLDSFCEWAPCPADSYEPPKVIEPSKVMELSPVHNNSSSSDFFILTFDCWGDRFNRSDEPPDTGIFARLPKPKPPKFPPQSASQPQVDQTSRNYPETIPKLFHRVAAGSSTQPARSPPGGDAMF